MQRLQTAQAHPDADLLNAFSEQALTTREREQVLTHLAICATCREVVSFASPPVQEVGAPQAAARPTAWKWSILRWGAVAASAVIVVIAVSIGHYEKKATSVAPVTSDAVPMAVPGRTEQKVPRDETLLQPAASSGMKAPQIRYEKIAPRSRKDGSVEQLNVGLRADNADVQKKGLDAPVAHAAVGGMLASRPALAPTTDDLASPKLADSTASGLRASLDDNALRRPAPAPPRAPGMGIEGAARPSVSETVEVTSAAPTVETQTSTPQAVAKSKQQESVHGSADQQVFSLNRAKQYNSLDLKWQVTPDGYLQNSTDQGRNWISQLPDQRFTHVQTIGSHVWACGTDGVLMHSTDGGMNWIRVTPADKNAKLQGDITSIVFADVNHGTLKTSVGETWSTSDAGQNWKKK